MLGCRNETSEFKPGAQWVEKHIRYECSPEGVAKVLGKYNTSQLCNPPGCVDEAGLFIELGHDILMGGTVHRCYKVQQTTYYHRYTESTI